MKHASPRKYLPAEIADIVHQARMGGLGSVRCPREQGMLDVYNRVSLRVGRGDPIKGVRYGDYDDLQEISVTCHRCGAGAVQVSLIEAPAKR